MDQLFQDKERVEMERPVWCSDELWETLSQVMTKDQMGISFSFSQAERKILRKPKPIRVSDWAEKYRVLTVSSLPGSWKNSVTPYLVGIMDAAGLAFVREIVLCKSPQCGGSEVGHNIMGYLIDRAPGPALYVYPDEKTARENSQDRVLPMIQSSNRLRQYFTGVEKDKSSYRIKLQHMTIHFGWGRSVASIANKPIRYGISDEIDKPGFEAPKKETGVLKLIDKRFTTFRSTYLHIKISTPTVESGNVWVELNAVQVIFDYQVRCPLCGDAHIMDFKFIKWDGGSQADPNEIMVKNLAWYECPACSGRWDETVRNRAVQAGDWIARGTQISIKTYLKTERPARLGFHIPAWISYFVSFGEIVAAFLEGLKDPVAMQDFLNSYCALPWKDIEVKADEEAVLAHKNHLPAGIVPKGHVALTCGVDVQKAGFWFVVRSWIPSGASHLVQYGYLTTWEDVFTLIFNTRYQIEGQDPAVTMPIWRAGIDSGGGKAKDDDWSKTEEVYHWVRKHGREIAFAIKGASNPQIKKVNPRVIDKMARGNRNIPGGLVLYFLDMDKFKDQLHWRLDQGPEDDQAFTLNADTGLDYARQILAERREKDRSGKSSWIQLRHDNHLLDCENIAAACAEPEWAPSLQFIANNQANTTGPRVVSKGVENG